MFIAQRHGIVVRSVRSDMPSVLIHSLYGAGLSLSQKL